MADDLARRANRPRFRRVSDRLKAGESLGLVVLPSLPPSGCLRSNLLRKSLRARFAG